MGDHRSMPRHRLLKAATISFAGEATSRAVRNLSDSGALLEEVSPIGITLLSCDRGGLEGARSSGARRNGLVKLFFPKSLVQWHVQENGG